MLKHLQAFQQSGSLFLQQHAHALLGDEPGLGKTLQAIDAAQKLSLKTMLVVCPASVRTGWYQELTECGAGGLWDVISYNEAVAGKFKLGDYDGLILDEGHFLKTPESQRTQAIFANDFGVARRVHGPKWVLTGSPVLNRPRELYPVLKCLHPGFAADSFAKFAQQYCNAYFDGRGINTKGASRLDELGGRLEGFMLRRTQEEVWDELPELIVTRVPILASREGMAAIEAVENEIYDREAKLSAAAEDFSQLGDLAKILHAVGLAKVKAGAEFVRELLETQEKVVVFTQHRDVLMGWAHELRDYDPVTYQGGMNDAEKQNAVIYFRTMPQCKVFIGNIKAAGTGINGLQDVASTVVFGELSWVPEEMKQAIFRLRRIGQKAKRVSAYVLHVPGSMESAVLGVQNAKGSVIGRLLGETGWKS